MEVGPLPIIFFTLHALGIDHNRYSKNLHPNNASLNLAGENNFIVPRKNFNFGLTSMDSTLGQIPSSTSFNIIEL